MKLYVALTQMKKKLYMIFFSPTFFYIQIELLWKADFLNFHSTYRFSVCR